MPGYNVVGIDCDTDPNNIIRLSGAIHCITRAVGVSEPLLISHKRLRNTDNKKTPDTVSAYMNHVSGIANATLYWTTDTITGYTAVSMNDAGSGNWEAQIPAQPLNTQVFYYVHGEANSGKQQVRPIVAPLGYWKFQVRAPNSINETAVSVGMDDIFPNPSHTVACVSVHSNQQTNAKIEVYDLMGRSVQLVHQGEVAFGDSKYFIDSSILPTGVYLVELKVGTNKTLKKLVVK
jgi:hypothetical protein